MTPGRFFANSPVVSGLWLGMANTVFAQSDWSYGLVGEKPTPSPDEIKQVVEGGWWSWSWWPWVIGIIGLVALIALLLHFWRRRREPEIIVNPTPQPPPNGDGKVLGDITPPPPPAPSATLQAPATKEPPTRIGWKFRRGIVRDEKVAEPEQATAAPAAVAAVVVEQPPAQEEPTLAAPPSVSVSAPTVEVVKCGNCQAEMPVGSKFCTACGKNFVGNFPTPATTVVVKSLFVLALVFARVANAAPLIDHCNPPLLAWDGQARTFECVGSDLSGLANAKVSNIPEVTGTVVRSTSTTVVLRLTAVRNLSASYNSVDFSINGNKVGKPIVLVSPQEAGRQSFFHNAYMREVKAMITTAMATGDAKARKDAAEALALAKKALTASAGGGKVDSKLLERLAKLEEEMRQQPVEATIRTMVRQEADSVANGLRSEIEGAKKQVDETATAVRNEMRTSKDQSNASVRSLEGRVGALEASTARDRAVIQATACAVLSDDGGWLGQGPSNRRKRAIRDASARAGYQPCPKK